MTVCSGERREEIESLMVVRVGNGGVVLKPFSAPRFLFNSVVDNSVWIDTIEPLIRLTILSATAIFGPVDTSLGTRL